MRSAVIVSARVSKAVYLSRAVDLSKAFVAVGPHAHGLRPLIIRLLRSQRARQARHQRDNCAPSG